MISPSTSLWFAAGVVVVVVVRDGAGVGAEEENNPPPPPASVGPGDGAALADGVPPKLNAISSSFGGWMGNGG